MRWMMLLLGVGLGTCAHLPTLDKAQLATMTEICEYACTRKTPHLAAVQYLPTEDACRCWDPLLPSEEVGIDVRPTIIEFPAPHRNPGLLGPSTPNLDTL